MSQQFLEKLKTLRTKGLAIVHDDFAPNSRAILIAAAELASDQLVNQAISISGGLCSVVLSEERATKLHLQRMHQLRNSVTSDVIPTLDLCISVEAREGVSTGISSADRARTIAILAEADPDHSKLVSPGHIFPIIARDGCVLMKAALHEAALDIVKIAGFTDAALVLDLLDSSGEFASLQHVTQIAEQQNLSIFSISEVIRHRLEHECLIQRVAQTSLPSRFATGLKAFIYRSIIHDGEHLALVKGEIDPDRPTLVRVQPEFTFGDVFGGSTPPTRALIHSCLSEIERSGSGVFVYLRRPSGGELGQQVGSWLHEFQNRPRANMREYGLGSQILRDLGVKQIELLTNSRNKLVGVKSFGIEIVSTRPIVDREIDLGNRPEPELMAYV